MFNKTQRYQELKRKKYLSALSKLEKKKEEEKKIMDLFSHSSKNSKNYIDPSMFQDQTIKKILKCNKRAFGVPGSDKMLPDIKPSASTKNILSTDRYGKRLANILYNNTYRNSIYCKNILVRRILEEKKDSSAFVKKNDEKQIDIDNEIDVDLQLKKNVEKHTLEFGQYKHKVGGCFLYKRKNF